MTQSARSLTLDCPFSTSGLSVNHLISYFLFNVIYLLINRITDFIDKCNPSARIIFNIQKIPYIYYVRDFLTASYYLIARDSNPSSSRNRRNGTKSSASYFSLKALISSSEETLGSNSKTST